MRIILISIISILSSVPLLGQDSLGQEKTNFVEVAPEFPGGTKKLYKYIAKNLRYPEEALKQKVKGKVYVKFIINEFGEVVKESVQIHESDSPLLNQEAKRLIMESPKWKPARVTPKGETSKVTMILPIIFNYR